MKCFRSHVSVSAVFLLFVTMTLVESYNTQRVINRTKRGFRDGIVGRIAHGFGKRAEDGFVQDRDDIFPKEFQSMISVEDLVSHLLAYPDLAEAVIRRHVDTNGDGMVSMDELLGKDSLV